MAGSKPTKTPAKRASLPSALSFAISSRRTGPMTFETIRVTSARVLLLVKHMFGGRRSSTPWFR